MTPSTKSRLTLPLLIALSVAGAASTADAHTPSLTSQDLVYGYDEMFDFDIGMWLAAHAPHLSSQAETISHWAGFSGISPRILLALMELQTGVVGNPAPAAGTLQRPFGALVAERGFDGQIREVAQSLRDVLYAPDDRALSGPVALSEGNPLRTLFQLAGSSPDVAATLGGERFVDTYRRLFDREPRTPAASSRFASPLPASTVPPVNLLQFPFPLGQRWHIGGAHTSSGSGSHPLSSLDMFQGGGWFSDQRTRWVSASAAGTFKRHSSCFAEIVHAGGWSTTYYHLMNIRHATGARVAANTPVANPANTPLQALCNGGMSTGPHQHWTLKSNGREHHLNGVTVSGYLVTATGNSYDTRCSRFNLGRKGETYCAGWYTNLGVDAP